MRAAYFVVPAFYETWSHISCRRGQLRSSPAQEEAKSILAPLIKWWQGNKRDTPVDDNVSMTLSRWINVDGNGTRVALDVPKGSNLMHALKAAARRHTDFHYTTSGVNAAEEVTTSPTLVNRVRNVFG